VRGDRGNLPVIIGFVTSVLLHLVLMLPLMLFIMTARSERPPIIARFDPEDFSDFVERETEEDPSTKLGLEDGSPSSMTWIGYDEYEEHLARLASTEQAAFVDQQTSTDRISGAAPGSVLQPAQPVPDPVEEEPAAEPTLDPPQPVVDAPSPAAARETATVEDQSTETASEAEPDESPPSPQTPLPVPETDAPDVDPLMQPVPEQPEEPDESEQPTEDSPSGNVRPAPPSPIRCRRCFGSSPRRFAKRRPRHRTSSPTSPDHRSRRPRSPAAMSHRARRPIVSRMRPRRSRYRWISSRPASRSPRRGWS
jgi:hypothetical protein